MRLPVDDRMKSRAAFAFLVGALCGAYVVARGRGNPSFVSDFDQVWAGARALLQGKDPYVVVGVHGEFVWKWPLYYPVPALLVVAPLAFLPVVAARAIFAGITASLLAWGATRDGWHRWPVFLSVAFFVNVDLVQWSALYAAAYFLPLLAVLGVAKPNLGAALAASARTNRSLVALAAGAVILVGLSELVQPGWHREWLANLRSAEHFRPPVARLFGFLLLLAAFKWRRPEARWLLALSIVPLPPSFYDVLLLAVVCSNVIESLVFTASTLALYFYVAAHVPQPDYASWGHLVGNAVVLLCYLPALAMVLRKPNEGVLPAFAQRWARRATSDAVIPGA